MILRLGNLGKLGGFKYLTGGQYVFFEHTFTKRTGLEARKAFAVEQRKAQQSEIRERPGTISFSMVN